MRNLLPLPSKLVKDQPVLILLIYSYTNMSHFNVIEFIVIHGYVCVLSIRKKVSTEIIKCFKVFFSSIQWVSFLSLSFSYNILEQFTVQSYRFGNQSQLRLYITFVRRSCCQKFLGVEFMKYPSPPPETNKKAY